MHTRVWTVSVYLFIVAILGLTGVAILAIWGVLPKETVWKAFASGGVLALLLLALSAALSALGNREVAVSKPGDAASPKETTLKI